MTIELLYIGSSQSNRYSNGQYGTMCTSFYTVYSKVPIEYSNILVALKGYIIDPKNYCESIQVLRHEIQQINYGFANMDLKLFNYYKNTVVLNHFEDKFFEFSLSFTDLSTNTQYFDHKNNYIIPDTNIIYFENDAAHIIRNGKHCFFGIVKVKNISFEKHVIVHYTTNKWESQNRIEAVHHFMNEFRFYIPIQNVKQELELAIQFTTDSEIFWLNNNNRNFQYQIEQMKLVDLYRQAINNMEPNLMEFVTEQISSMYEEKINRLQNIQNGFIKYKTRLQTTIAQCQEKCIHILNILKSGADQ
ncbi:Protein_phosphatase 1 regulatory subunit 3C-B [Hexamita inflata]|uniref:Protein phosphatase 1 regulatory subunit 3C-B n=1 Tax=Hexamita inflata TaxID=28002 RepID=A0AA86U1Y3_9EUKA|nr:Protein phosphatase 1 regulatory subunit 3C-B [Hexamita inflata]